MPLINLARNRSRKIMKQIALFFLVMTLSISGFGQILTLKDRENNQPLVLATIASSKPKAFTMTNSQGQARMDAFKGAEKIEIRLVGYKVIHTPYSTLEQSGFEVFMEASEISLDQVVVSATRWNQSGRDVPSKVTSIKPKDIILQNPQTAADLLGTSGEVFIQKSQQGGGSPMIRGFSTNRLLYTIDGVRMNTAIFRSGNLQNVISLDPFTMENAEVLFGPGSIIYGSDAIGGVMSFQTLIPQFTLTDKPFISGKGYTRYATANQEKTGHFDVNLGWEKWAAVTSISHNNFGDLRMGTHGPKEYLRDFYVQRQDSIDIKVDNDDPKIQKPTGYSQTNLMQKVRYKPNDQWDFQYGFHYAATTDYPRYDRLIQILGDEQPRSGQWSYGPQIWMMNNLNITHSQDNPLYDHATLRLAQQYFEESRINRGFNELWRSENTEKVDAYSINLDFNKAFGGKAKLFYGLDAVRNEVESTGKTTHILTNETDQGPSRYPMATWSSYAVYFTYQYHPSRKLTLQTGARYNLFSLKADFSTNLPYYPLTETETNINNSALTGSLGMVYHPRPTWSVSANVSTGFRAPNVDDMGKVFDSEPGAVTVPNTTLHAEYAYNAEAGLAKVFGESVKLDLTVYYTLLNDAMVRRDFTLNGQDSIRYEGQMSKVQAIQNAAVSGVYGLQTGLEVKLPAGFGISSQYNYQKGEEELDDGTTSPSRHAAPWFGVTRLTYASKGLDMQLYAMYNGKRSFADMPVEERGKAYIYATDANGNPYSPGWYTLNLKAMYQLNTIFSISGGVENLTDQRYRPYSSGLVAAGRNFIIALRGKF